MSAASNATTIAAGGATAGAAELPSVAETLSKVDLSSTPSSHHHHHQHDDDDKDTEATLSRRGAEGASAFQLPEGLKRMLANMYDPITNPDGIINAGVADNSLCREELLEYFLSKDRLKLTPADLTYADRFTTSTRLLESISALFNEKTPDWPDKSESPLPLKKVTPDHVAIGSGATGILDELFWNLCDQGDGVLLSAPYYNAFDNDLTNRAKAKVVEVKLPLPDAEGRVESLESSSFSQSTVAAYEQAYARAASDGIKVKAMILCNPHNPTGTIYPRTTVIELARFAAKHQLHFVSDEIYARSCFITSDVPTPALFHSILSIDTQAECGLDPKYVHVVTSASKDFGVNGFRLGVLISQHNPALQRAMSCVGLLSQSASPATVLWDTWLRDDSFLQWYFTANRKRLQSAYETVSRFFKHHRLAYYPSNSGFFLMVDFSKPAGVVHHKDKGDKEEDEDEEEGRKKEAKFVDRLLDEGVFIAPGTQYHHPIPGWFRFTFSMPPATLKLALKRTEQAMGVKEQDRFEVAAQKA